MVAKTLGEWWETEKDLPENDNISLAEAIWKAATKAAEEKFTSNNNRSEER